MNDDTLGREFRLKLQTLERSYPRELDDPKRLWLRMAEKRPERQQWRKILGFSAAASVALLIVVGWLWWPSQSSLTNDSVTAWPDALPDEQNDALAYVARLCKGDHVVCTSEDFRALEADLAALAESLDEVNREMAKFGDDEHLLRAKERIEDQQIRVIRAMVQML